MLACMIEKYVLSQNNTDFELWFIHLKVSGEHWANQEAEERWREQGQVLELEQVRQEQRAEVYLVDIGHLNIKKGTRDSKKEMPEDHHL